ncbi:MAG: hypothetical protein ACON5N_19800 [Akkermansiaceae bacterium]
MLSASDLSEEQIEEIRKWVAEGAQMADVQKRLKEIFDLNATYMDTRFISLDLGLEFVQEEEPEPDPAEDGASDEPEMPEQVAAPASPMVEVLPEDAGAPSVSVGLDQVAIPGSMVSGTITFSDGERGRWMIDDMGRSSIDPETPDYQPTQADLEDFQAKLQDIFENQM